METKGCFFDLTEDEAFALEMLVIKGYAFPANSKIGAFRRMLHKAWEETFPGIEFAKPKQKKVDYEQKQ